MVLDTSNVTGEHADHYKNLPEQITTASNELTKAATIEEARDSFERLSRPMAMWATKSAPAKISVVFCPMANASWLQPTGDIKNPYYGSSMLACGEVVAARGASK